MKEQIILNGISRIDRLEHVSDSNTSKIINYCNLIKTRIDAIESVLTSPIGVLRLLFFSIFNKKRAESMINESHERIVNGLKKVPTKAGMILISILLSSCATPQKRNIGTELIQDTLIAQKQKNEGLKRFPCIDNPDSMDCDDEVYDGKAGWVK